jgi:broad specificity phosphatase PhoE
MRTASSGFGSYDPPGGEPALVFGDRLRHFIDEHISYQPGRTVALVTHFGVMRVVLPMLLGGHEGMPGMKCIPNGFFTILDIDCRGRATPVSGEG